jgi:glutathione S-transferase
VAKPVSAKYLKLYSELLEKSPSGFFIGTHETHADFWIAEFIFTLNGMIPEIVSNYPILLAHLNRIHELPQLKEYIATRKPTAL